MMTRQTPGDLHKLGECPECGDSYGYFYYQITRTGIVMDFTGKNIDTTDGICEKELKRVYCVQCCAHIATYPS